MQITHKALFTKYTDTVVVQKSLQFARWTLPQLMAFLYGTTGVTQRLERDYQSSGALLVNNLASKLAGLLFPSSRPFYKIKASKQLAERAKKRGIKDAELAAGFAKLEMESCQQLYLNASYEQLVMACKHLIVTGNVLLYRDSKNSKTISYGLQSYAVRRDGRGNMMDCVLKEFTDFDSLPADVRSALLTKHSGKYADEDCEARHHVELYTRIKRTLTTGDRVIYVVTQQADDMDVGTPGKYPEHLCPWQAVCWSLVAGENYGRGLVEDFAGGFAKLSDLALASTLYSIASTKLVNLVAPGMGADVDELQDAETGDYVQGQEKAVTMYEGGDANKMKEITAQQEAEFSQLARAFMYKANTRNAERVTAFELKQDAIEAENTLGGVYSSLSASMQIPLAHVLLTEVNPDSLAGIVTKAIKLDIMAGIPALGRQADVQNLAAATQDAAAIVPVLAKLDQRIDPAKLIDVIMAGQSVDVTTIHKDADTMEREAAANKQAAMGQQQIDQSTTLADQSAQLTQIQG